ncbi:MAG: hypothetical protein FWH00_03130 [Oscillospiraceae bacterium]|nr:hypothetical protein [Oscillospiraceae bacterium]
MPNHHTYRFDRDMKGHGGRRSGGIPSHHHHHRHRPGFGPVFPVVPWWVWPAIISGSRR